VSGLRVLFRIAAGPRLGYGHMVRAARLADALDAEGWISIRGNDRDVPPARSLRRAANRTAAIDVVRPDLLVLDTPVEADARRWCHAARRRRLPVVSVHDAGIAPVASDLAVDGSVAAKRSIPSARRSLHGPRYAVLDARISAASSSRSAGHTRVLIALGGGSRRHAARALAQAIARRLPDAQIVVAGGFERAAPGGVTVETVEWLAPQNGLVDVLARTDVAVVAGGLTLYEAAAMRTAVVGVAVVPAQRPAIRAFAQAGAAIDPAAALGGRALNAWAIARIANDVARLLGDPARRRRMAIAARRLVDGRGAERVASAIVGLMNVGRRAA
jgi:UDP-2,4-diacetamido-2,4,6-trideoxy-beta-L-altropyranose hydrolase